MIDWRAEALTQGLKKKSYRVHNYRVFNLKVGRQLCREYLTSDAIYNGSAAMTLYYYMCGSW